MIFMFFAVCYGCYWCFNNNHPYLAMIFGLLFAAVYFIDRWFDKMPSRLGARSAGPRKGE